MDYLAKLHWEALVQQHIDSNSEKTRVAVSEFNRALDVWLDAVLPQTVREIQGCSEVISS